MTLGAFRDYSPGLNRFLSRDMYNGALDDLDLGINPFTANRYAFGAGNPVSNVELDGHWLLGKLVKRITKTVRAVVSDSYKRQDRTLDGVEFRVRGYLSKNCIQDLQCPFEEYRAQALAIRWANL